MYRETRKYKKQLIDLKKYNLTEEEIKYVANEVAEYYDRILDNKYSPILLDNYNAYKRFAISGQIPLSSRGPTKGRPLAAILSTWDRFEKKVREYEDRKYVSEHCDICSTRTGGGRCTFCKDLAEKEA